MPEPLRSSPFRVLVPLLCAVVTLGAGIALLIRAFTLGRLHYVRDGTPIVGRVLNVSEYWFDPQMPRFGYRLNVEYVDPASSELRSGIVDSGLVGGQQKYEKVCLTVERGDYITLVSHKWRYDYPLQAYGFLGLNEQYEIIRTLDGKHQFSGAVPNWMLQAAGVIGVFAFIFFNLCYTLPRLWPLRQDEDGMICGALVIALLCSVSVFRYYSARQAPEDRVGVVRGILLAARGFLVLLVKHLMFHHAVEEDSPGFRRAKPFLMTFLFGTVGGFMSGAFLLATLNGLLDFRQPEQRRVRVVQLKNEKIHIPFGGIENVRVVYTGQFMVAPDEVPAARVEGRVPAPGDFVVLNIKPGLFGWRWIKSVSRE